MNLLGIAALLILLPTCSASTSTFTGRIFTKLEHASVNRQACLLSVRADSNLQCAVACSLWDECEGLGHGAQATSCHLLGTEGGNREQYPCADVPYVATPGMDYFFESDTMKGRRNI